MPSLPPPPLLSIRPPLDDPAGGPSGAARRTAATTTSGSSADLEGVFFRLHERLIYRIRANFSPFALSLFEALAVINALSALLLLVYLHVTYVGRAEDTCLAKVISKQLAEHSGGPVDVLRLELTGIWSTLKSEDVTAERRLESVVTTSASSTGGEEDYLVAPQLLLSVWLKDPMFVFAKERGFLMLDELTRKRLGIRELSLRIATEDCFDSHEKYVLDNFVGYDTIVLNALRSVMGGKGYLYSLHSRELLRVAGAHQGGLVLKLGAIATTLFIFFVTTTLVNHTLRETQERMLKFTYDLQDYVRRGLPYRYLILNHVIGSLVFVPVMVGVLFFLFEFFNDQLLAFMVLTVVWCAELYSVVTLRTAHHIRVFPRLFFLYFSSFHLYFFVFPTGFSYLALTVCVVCLQHAMLAFFVRLEMPALAPQGHISAQHPRDTIENINMLLPEEVHVGTSSLAFRALVGARSPARPSSPAAGVRRPPTPAAHAGSDGSFVARPGRKKRTTISGSNDDDRDSQISGNSPPYPETESSPLPTGEEDGAAPFSVGPASPGLSGSAASAPRSLLGEDDASSTGWEIGGD